MKNFTMLSMFAVAALTVAAGSASAQTQIYKADIPMSFRAGRAVFTPGAYSFDVQMNAAGHYTLLIRRADAKLVAMIIPVAGWDAPKAWRDKGNPVLEFLCVGQACSLRQLYSGHDVTTIGFAVPKLSPAAAERASIVTFGLTKAD